MIAVLLDVVSVTPPLPSLLLAQPGGAPGSNAPAIVLLCAAMTLGLLFYTFYFQDEAALAPEKDRLAFLRERKDAIYENLRDLNFEYKAGKFPESDYQQMHTAMEDEAAALLAEIGDLESGGVPSNSMVANRKARGKSSILKGAKQ